MKRRSARLPTLRIPRGGTDLETIISMYQILGFIMKIIINS